MDKEILIVKIGQGLTQKQIASELNVSQSTVRHWLKKYDLHVKRATRFTFTGVCSRCSTAISTDRRKYCSKCASIIRKEDGNTRQKKYYKKHKPDSMTYTAWKSKGNQHRRDGLISHFGGKCIICGYDKNGSALVFHHRDGKDKSFALDRRRCSTYNWDRLLSEAKKCDLLCQNCHHELHNPICD